MLFSRGTTGNLKKWPLIISADEGASHNLTSPNRSKGHRLAGIAYCALGQSEHHKETATILGDMPINSAQWVNIDWQVRCIAHSRVPTVLYSSIKSWIGFLAFLLTHWNNLNMQTKVTCWDKNRYIGKIINDNVRNAIIRNEASFTTSAVPITN